jgi:hypothetical protein
MIPFRVAVGHWVKIFGEDEIIRVDNTVIADKYYYTFYSKRARENISGVFFVVVPDKQKTTGKKIKFDVGLHKSNNRWYVDEKKLLDALNKKRYILSDEEVQNHYFKLKTRLGFEGDIVPLLDICD